MSRHAMFGAAVGCATALVAMSEQAISRGEVPKPVMALGIVALLSWAGATLADRHRDPVATVAAIAVGQVTLHIAVTVPPDRMHRHVPERLPDLHVGPALVGQVATILVIAVFLSRIDAAGGLVGMVMPRLPVGPPAHAPLWVAVSADAIVDPAKNVLLRRTRARRGPPLAVAP